MIKGLASIIIRSKNEEKWIGSCLKSIFEQSYKNFEIILVDNYSNDRTINVAKKYNLKIIKIKNFLPGKAINKGIRASNGEYIVCLSAHCIPTNKSWLRNILNNLKTNKVGAVYGRQEPLSFSSPLDKRDLIITFGLDKKIQKKDYFFHNANSAFKRKIWEKTKFDEKITNIEDRVWAKQLIELKYHIVYEPKASVYHYHGIHQNLDIQRAKNVVNIIENLNDEKNKIYKKKLINLNIICVIPTKGEPIYINKSNSLLEKTILDAKQSSLIKKIYVATDNKNAIKVAKKNLINDIILRTNKLSEKHTSIVEVLNYVLDKIETREKNIDFIVIIDPSHPFRENNIIDNMLRKIYRNKYDSIIAVKSEFRKVWKFNKKNFIEVNEENFMPREIKDEKLLVSLLGLCFITSPNYIKDTSMYGSKITGYEVKDPLSAVQIRSKKDLVLFKKYKKKW